MNYRLVPRAEPEAQRPTRIDCGGTPPEPEAQRPTRIDTGGTPGADAEREILQAAIPRAGGELKKAPLPPLYRYGKGVFSDGIHSVFFRLHHGKCSCLLHLQMVGWGRIIR